MRLTKIVCTLGPSLGTKEQIKDMVERGMNVARVNFSHGSEEQHTATLTMLRDLVDKEQIPVAILLDTKGCEIRTGDVEKPIEVLAGDEVVFSHVPLPQEKRTVIMVNYPEFAKDAKDTKTILLDNGETLFEQISNDGTSVVAKALDSGSIGSRRHVNLPGVDISLPSITEKDWKDLELGVKMGVDFVALSFVRRASEIEEVRAFLAKHNSTMGIISKIETKLAVENIESIIAASDGIMVARGDLGAEIPFEQVPAVQDKIVRRCWLAGKPVIVATHMLESMIKNPMPTRAEVTDVAYAATSRTDATMLSGETAKGDHPKKAVEAMSRILHETEQHLQPVSIDDITCDTSNVGARSKAAALMAQTVGASAIIVLTKSGLTARQVSKFRPRIPIIAFTPSTSARGELLLHYGVVPALLPFNEKEPEVTVLAAIAAAKKAGHIAAGQKIIIVSDTKSGENTVATVQVRTVS